MCLLALFFRAMPDAPLVVAANREEFYDRGGEPPQILDGPVRAVGGRGYGRIDMRLDEENQPYVLEVNCNPCLDEGMGIARSAEKAGISFPKLLQLIIQAALEPLPHDEDVPMLPVRTRRSPAVVDAVTVPEQQ